MMSSSCSNPEPVNARQLLEQAIQELAPGVVALHGAAQPRKAEHLAVRTVLLDHAVGVQEHRVALPDEPLGLLVHDARHEAEREPGGPQLDHAVAVRT